MTTPTQYGEMSKKPQKQNVEIEGLETLKPGNGIQVDKDTKYEYASELSTDGMPLIDPGGGPVNVIRVFTFKMNPEKKLLPTGQEIFSSHAKQIETILWGDGLRPLDGVSPRVIIDNKNSLYRIFVPC